MSGIEARQILRSVSATVGIESALEGYLGSNTTGDCRCIRSFDEGTLTIDSTNCDGDLGSSVACRRSVVTELADRDVSDIVVQSDGLEYRYDDNGIRLLSAAGRFIELLGDREDRLARVATEHPREATGELQTRVGPVADVGVESGLTQIGTELDGNENVLSPAVGFSIGHYFLDREMGTDASLRDVFTLETGTEVRLYTRPDRVPLYTLDVIDLSLSVDQRQCILEGYEAIADGVVEGERASSKAVESVSTDSMDPVVTSVLTKHTSGYGILEDIFSDPRVSDVYITSPVSANPIRVVVDGESMTTNVHLTPEGVNALASRVRRTSGRAFSRASPTIDATADLENGTEIRIAGVTDPVSEGVAFAFRKQADDRFTLPALIANETMTAAVAAFLSVAIERNAATLVAGTRGAGKTTLLGTLLYELTPDTRTVVIEDTPELPVSQLQSVDRDVQALRTGSETGPEITAEDALKTALRLGDGALVVGEIRGDEARVLYEAMRVGANANAVMGTIHGDGGDAVYERVISDLGVEPSSFGATDLIVTVQTYRTPGGRTRRLSAIEEVVVGDDDIWFEPLYEIEDLRAVSTGRIERGESILVDRVSAPTESYSDVLQAIGHRKQSLETLAADGRTAPSEIADVYAERNRV